MMLKSNSAAIGSDSFPMLEDKILPLLEQIGIGPDFNMEEIFEIIAMAIIACGAVVAGVAFIGFCGACCKWRPFLVVYAIILLCVSAGEMFAVYYFMEVKEEFECCGVNRQSETDDFSMSVWNSTRGSQLIPGYCCKGADYISGILLAGKECTTNPTSLNSFFFEVSTFICHTLKGHLYY
ncbi:uncharacterized protein LOC143081028 [Mytilus galloprovincialis]|uniref:uncharacterized protein LOC143081028 n=1 Tax=Mytilus galloprovincialis TaxID=29158 RepID=UPI003F7BD716